MSDLGCQTDSMKSEPLEPARPYDCKVTARASKHPESVVIGYLATLGMMLAAGIDIALPAFDSISKDLDIDRAPTLMVTVYLIGMAIGQLLWGPLSDRYGRKLAISAGLVVFVIGAAGSALAPNYNTLLTARLVWGLGAAAPAGLRAAVARDLYSGDKMARVISIMMAVFLIGPVFIPLAADQILKYSRWPILFWVAAAMAAFGIGFTLWFGETLSPQLRQPLSFKRFGKALQQITKTRITLAMILANMVNSAAFFVFLGSTQPVVSRIYDRGEQFAQLFALSGAISIIPLLLNNGLIDRYGADRMALIWIGISEVFAIAGLILAWSTGGVPPFWLWFGWLTAIATTMTLSTPSFSSLALEPMGSLAGTVASILYGAGFAGGALIAAIFEVRIKDDVTYFNLAFALCLTVTLAIYLWSGAGWKTRSVWAKK